MFFFGLGERLSPPFLPRWHIIQPHTTMPNAIQTKGINTWHSTTRVSHWHINNTNDQIHHSLLPADFWTNSNHCHFCIRTHRKQMPKMKTHNNKPLTRLSQLTSQLIQALRKKNWQINSIFVNVLLWHSPIRREYDFETIYRLITDRPSFAGSWNTNDSATSIDVRCQRIAVGHLRFICEGFRTVGARKGKRQEGLVDLEMIFILTYV